MIAKLKKLKKGIESVTIRSVFNMKLKKEYVQNVMERILQQVE